MSSSGLVVEKLLIRQAADHPVASDRFSDPCAMSWCRHNCGETCTSGEPAFLSIRSCAQEVRDSFGGLVEEAASGGLGQWKHGYEALANVILRDQFTRCIGSHLPCVKISNLPQIPDGSLQKGTFVCS